jgi:thiamine biosynthesis protein ThiS
MNIRLNGELRSLQQARTIPELLAEIGLQPQTVIVEHNGVALRRTEWPQATLAENDQIEIVKVVAGG